MANSHGNGYQKTGQCGVERRTDSPREGASISNSMHFDGPKDVDHSPHGAEQAQKRSDDSDHVQNNKPALERPPFGQIGIK